jgi:hypothetical protein
VSLTAEQLAQLPASAAAEYASLSAADQATITFDELNLGILGTISGSAFASDPTAPVTITSAEISHAYDFEQAHADCLAGKTYTLTGWGTYTGSATVWAEATDLNCVSHNPVQVAAGLLWVDAWAETNGVANPVTAIGAAAWYNEYTANHGTGLAGLFHQGQTLQPNFGAALSTAVTDVASLGISIDEGNVAGAVNAISGPTGLANNLGTSEPISGPLQSAGLTRRKKLPLFIAGGGIAAVVGAFFLL